MSFYVNFSSVLRGSTHYLIYVWTVIESKCMDSQHYHLLLDEEMKYLKNTQER